MPELPEVEYAAGQLRDRAIGQTIVVASAFHPAQARRLPPADLLALAGETIDRVERRAKVQLIHLGSGAILEVHFRMTGDWRFTAVAEAPPALERFRFETREGLRVSLVDPRALSVVRLHRPGTFTPIDAGPEPLTDAFTAAGFQVALTRRRGPIKPVLLDQHVVAGVGNIYASEALWEARIHPATPANRLRIARITRLHDAIRRVLSTASPERYYERPERKGDAEEATGDRWQAYGREGEPCRRCLSPIKRIVQAGRSTYYCDRCQRR
ncbi:bifunctional DNA-formamidopyrimidine glycosylase/DNA-(apurinic or apyrimidinic site) lyase [Gemmatimonas aurantiaca]|uniref:bifunctional DNA-formamidopyrimidine glycosylase/DNA-(apurinic or apyrimidinic site) lyase n=1 Tax=Gemmatimonas aurantiaca TaxID=173480 RepID=UPI00301C31AE